VNIGNLFLLNGLRKIQNFLLNQWRIPVIKDIRIPPRPFSLRSA
jgi:hypothetical protein